MGTLHHVQKRSGRSEEGVSESAFMAGILHDAQESCQPSTLAPSRKKILPRHADEENRGIVQKLPSVFSPIQQKGGQPYERPGWFRRDDFTVECPSGFLDHSCSGDGWRGEGLGIVHCR
jgi:hypothetical protein